MAQLSLLPGSIVRVPLLWQRRTAAASSTAALLAISLAGCAATSESRWERRHGSIKDEPVAGTGAVVPQRTPRAASFVKNAVRNVATPLEPAVVTLPSSHGSPAPRLPVVERQTAPVTVVIEQGAPRAEPKRSEDATSIDTARHIDTAKAEPKQSTAPIDPLPPPLNSAVPGVSRLEARPLTDTRRKPADAAAAVMPPVTPSAGSVLPTAPAQPVPATPLAASKALPAPPLPVSVPIPAITNVEKVSPQATPASASQPKLVPLSDEQRVDSVLQRADTYMKANRYQDARNVLEDAAKSGNPRLLVALAETFDPLHLRETFPRLARTGDPDRALALYEQARNAGARGLDAKLSALKVLAGSKR